MKYIRAATAEDAGRIAEIEIFNYRLYFYPIFQSDAFYFDELQVLPAAEALRKECNVLTVSSLPENIHWRKLYRLQDGEAVLIENNG